MPGPIELPVSLPPAALHLLSVQQILADLASLGEQEGTVLRRLADGRTQVRIGTRTVDLELGRTLETGTRFTARLVQGKLVLNLTPDAAAYSVHERVFDPGIREPALEITVRSLMQNLQDLGLAGDRGNLAVAQAVLMAGIPLTRDLIERLRRQLGELSGSKIDALAVLLRKRVPFDADLVRSMGRTLESKGDISRILGDLLRGRESIPEGSAVRRAMDRLETWLGDRTLVRESGQDGEGSAEWLGQWMRHSGLFYEAALAEGREAEDDLKRILWEIVRESEASKRAGAGTRETDAAGERARLLLDLVGQRQIASLDEPGSGDRTWTTVIPLVLDDEVTTIHFVVREDTSAARDAERPVEVMLRWDLPALGGVAGRLRQSGGNLSVTVGADSEDTMRLVRESLPALEESLGGIGYSRVRVRGGRNDVE
jgi:hypothetical protein